MNFETVKILVEGNANLNCTDNKNKTPFQVTGKTGGRKNLKTKRNQRSDYTGSGKREE